MLSIRSGIRRTALTVDALGVGVRVRVCAHFGAGTPTILTSLSWKDLRFRSVSSTPSNLNPTSNQDRSANDVSSIMRSWAKTLLNESRQNVAYAVGANPSGPAKSVDASLDSLVYSCDEHELCKTPHLGGKFLELGWDDSTRAFLRTCIHRTFLQSLAVCCVRPLLNLAFSHTQSNGLLK